MLYRTVTELLDFHGLPLVRELPPNTTHKAVIVNVRIERDPETTGALLVQTVKLTEV